MKFWVLLMLLFFTITGHAVTDCRRQALPTNDVNFCSSFVEAAKCQCKLHGSLICDKVKTIYNTMLKFFGSLERACGMQHDTDPQTCMDDWNCYWNGGNDSLGRPCSSSGLACPKEE